MFRPGPDSMRTADLSDMVSESDKLKAPYLVGNIDAAIAQLVRSKGYLRKYRDLYEGYRDPREYKYLEQNFGIGNPGRVKMIPIIRNRVQVLLGQHLAAPIKKNITCTDQQSIGFAEQEKLEFGVKQLAKQLGARLHQQLQSGGNAMPIASTQSGAEGTAAPAQPQGFSDTLLQELNQQIHSFQSTLEIGAQHVLDELLQSPDLRLKEKFTELLEKLLVESQPYYRVVAKQSGSMPGYEVIPPEELHFSLPPGKRNLRDCTRIVRRRLMTRQQVLTTYGYLLGKDEREIVAGGSDKHPNVAWDTITLGEERYLDYYGTGLQRSSIAAPGTGEYANWVNSPTKRDRDYLGASPSDLIEVFHVEWLATNELELDEEAPPAGYSEDEDNPAWHESDYDPIGGLIEQQDSEQKKASKNTLRYREDRYEGVRIGSSIYCALGRSRNVVRSLDDPWSAGLSYRGYVHDFSLVGKTKDIQDSSDILHYQAENLVASSGVKGSKVDVALVPKWLGDKPEERIQRHRAYRKQGLDLGDSSQEGAQATRGGTFAGDFDESLDGNALRAIREQIAYLDEVAGSITGVNRQMLGAITDQDLVGNTDAARVQSTLITKPLFQIINTLIQESLTDLLNACRLLYREGRRGILTLGEAGKLAYTLHPRFSLADYRVYVGDGQEEAKQLQAFQGLAKEFIAAQLLQPEDLIDLVTATSISGIRQHLKQSAAQARASQTTQLQQQVEQLTKQLQQVQQQLAGVDQQKQQQLQGELSLKQQELQIMQQQAADKKSYDDSVLELKQEEVALQRDQIAFNKSALPVKNVA